MKNPFAARRQARSLGVWVDYSALFSGTELLLAGWVDTRGAALDAVELLDQSGVIPTNGVEIVRGSRPDVSAAYESPERTPGFVFRASLARAVPSPSSLRLKLRAGSRVTEIGLGSTGDSGETFRASIRGFSDAERRVAAALARKLLGADALEPVGFSSALEGGVSLALDYAAVVSGQGVFLRGWLVDPEQLVTAAYLRVGAETSSDLLDRLGRVRRSDVERAFPSAQGRRPGFLCWLPIQIPPGATSCRLLCTTRAHDVLADSTTLSILPRNPIRLTEELFSGFDAHDATAIDILERHIAPAISATSLISTNGAARVYDFGPRPSKPRRSLVIPLYGRGDFVFYQVNDFARDSDFEETELIYVVDDPRLLDETVSLARSLYQLMGLPIRLVDSGINRGFAGATNLGVAHSSGRTLVLMNSDVLPTGRGWLRRLEHELEALPERGIVAPRLIYPDSTIQHDGIAFVRHPTWPGLWFNDHPGKGLPASLVRAPRVERVPAVTAACLMVERELYESLGGLDEGYLVGDFEDSDFCLKAARQGRFSHVVRDVTLYHLERRSQAKAGDGAWRMSLTLYNAWRHTRTWGSYIAEVSA